MNIRDDQIGVPGPMWLCASNAKSFFRIEKCIHVICNIHRAENIKLYVLRRANREDRIYKVGKRHKAAKERQKGKDAQERQ